MFVDPNIDNFRVAAPCSMTWQELIGDDRARFCERCQLNVYNISGLNRAEAATLITGTEGRICVRLFRRMDGTILTRDCPVGLQAMRRRISSKAAAVFATIAALANLTLGQNTFSKKPMAADPLQTRITRSQLTAAHPRTSISGLVIDVQGAVVAHADVLIINVASKERRNAATSDEGRFRFDLVPGRYTLTINASGFKKHRVKMLVLERDQFLDLEITLQMTKAIETVGVLVSSPLLDPSSANKIPSVAQVTPRRSKPE